jgi:hypothetical protein
MDKPTVWLIIGLLLIALRGSWRHHPPAGR